VFAVSLLSQFLTAHGPVFWSSLALGAVWAAVTGCWYLLFTWAVDRGRRLVSTQPSTGACTWPPAADCSVSAQQPPPESRHRLAAREPRARRNHEHHRGWPDRPAHCPRYRRVPPRRAQAQPGEAQLISRDCRPRSLDQPAGACAHRQVRGAEPAARQRGSRYQCRLKLAPV